MSVLQSHTEQVRRAHDAFYHALSDGDIRAVGACWTRDTPVSCQHSGWPAIHGRRAVLESWADRLNITSTELISLENVAIILTGHRAFLIALDRWDGLWSATTTLYRREGRDWRITHHQATAIRSYLT